MDGHELLDFFVNAFGCSSLDAYAYILLVAGAMMGGFAFFMSIFMDVGDALACLLCKFIRWGYKKFQAKRKEP